LGQAVGQIVVLKMLGQPHSNVMVWSSMHCGRGQNPEIVGQVEPVVSVIVTQVGEVEVEEFDQPETSAGQVTTTAASQAKVEGHIFENRDADMSALQRRYESSLRKRCHLPGVVDRKIESKPDKRRQYMVGDPYEDHESTRVQQAD
jgi:hypothetical protein